MIGYICAIGALSYALYINKSWCKSSNELNDRWAVHCNELNERWAELYKEALQKKKCDEEENKND